MLNGFSNKRHFSGKIFLCARVFGIFLSFVKKDKD